MFVTGPDVVKTVTHEDVDREHLGGASVHTPISGVAHLAAADEVAAMALARRILDHLPQNNLEKPADRPTTDPRDRRDPALDTLIPDEANQPYDMHDVITRVVDDADFLEIQPAWAANIIVGFARLGGHSVGIVAQPARGAGGRARHRCVGQGGALRAHLRRVQRAARHLRGRARASCPASPRSTAASSATARSCSTPTRRRRCPS